MWKIKPNWVAECSYYIPAEEPWVSPVRFPGQLRTGSRSKLLSRVEVLQAAGSSRTGAAEPAL